MINIRHLFVVRPNCCLQMIMTFTLRSEDQKMDSVPEAFPLLVRRHRCRRHHHHYFICPKYK